MSASDSDLSEASKTSAPPDHELEKALRREVVKAGREDVNFSYKYIRNAAEAKLGLTQGFYKSHVDWNQRSKDIIEEQMVLFDFVQCVLWHAANVLCRPSRQMPKALLLLLPNPRPKNRRRNPQSASLQRKRLLPRRDRKLSSKRMKTAPGTCLRP